MKIISKTVFWSRSLKSVATGSLLQESLACVDTTPSLLYCVNRGVCRRVRVCAYTYIGVHVQRHTVNRAPPLLPPSFLTLPLTLSVSLTSQHAARGQTCISLHSPLSLPFLFPPLFSTLLSLAFQPSFVVVEGGPKHERRQNVNARVCVEAHARPLSYMPPSVSCSHAGVVLC